MNTLHPCFQNLLAKMNWLKLGPCLSKNGFNLAGCPPSHIWVGSPIRKPGLQEPAGDPSRAARHSAAPCPSDISQGNRAKPTRRVSPQFQSAKCKENCKCQRDTGQEPPWPIAAASPGKSCPVSGVPEKIHQHSEFEWQCKVDVNSPFKFRHKQHISEIFFGIPRLTLSSTA